MHQGIKVGNFESRAVYEEQLQNPTEQPSQAFADERWRTQQTNENLAEFDRLMGEKNAELGYNRD